jgi:hypothetical protein
MGMIFINVKPKRIDNCIHRWGGIFWFKTRDFLNRQIIIIQATGCMVQGLNPSGNEIFLFSGRSRLALRKTQPPIQWVTGFFPGSKAGRV